MADLCTGLACARAAALELAHLNELLARELPRARHALAQLESVAHEGERG